MKNKIYAIMGGIIFLGGFLLSAFAFLLSMEGLEFGLAGLLICMILDGQFVLYAFSVMIMIFGCVIMRVNLREGD